MRKSNFISILIPQFGILLMLYSSKLYGQNSAHLLPIKDPFNLLISNSIINEQSLPKVIIERYNEQNIEGNLVINLNTNIPFTIPAGKDLYYHIHRISSVNKIPFQLKKDFDFKTEFEQNWSKPNNQNATLYPQMLSPFSDSLINNIIKEITTTYGAIEIVTNIKTKTLTRFIFNSGLGYSEAKSKRMAKKIKQVLNKYKIPATALISLALLIDEFNKQIMGFFEEDKKIIVKPLQ